MTQVPSGWYPDPAAGAPGAAPRQRYWDGERWTEHVHPSEPGHGTAAAPYPGVYADAVPAPRPAAASRHTTPDGEPLAGWWLRAVAYLLDTVVVGVLAAVIGFRPVSQIASAYLDFVDATLRAAEGGTPAPSQGDLLADVAGPIAVFTAITLLVQLVYNVGFLKALAATPGKLALGLRVRRRDAPGPLAWRTVLLRWLSQFGPAVLGLLPGAGLVATLYRLLDGLWPLWDARRQALHDKVAATNVVVRRRR